MPRPRRAAHRRGARDPRLSSTGRAARCTTRASAQSHPADLAPSRREVAAEEAVEDERDVAEVLAALVGSRGVMETVRGRSGEKAVEHIGPHGDVAMVDRAG